jgi:N,N'-diacetyllegionaminate synthase
MLKKIDNGILVIAEIGKNFIQTEEVKSIDEYLFNAKQLVKKAKKCGADAVKFQTHNVKDEQINITVFSPHFKGNDRYSWIKMNTDSTPLENFWIPLKEYCDKIKINFFSTPMSRGAAEILTQLDVDIWKVGSGDLLDFVMLDYLTSTKKPIILSSGMSTLEEIDKTISFLKKRNSEIALLHCVSSYPCSTDNLNLATIKMLKKIYKIPIGFSDHSLDNLSSIVACCMGAKIIEKHFSLSRDFWGSDHKVSVTPSELKELVHNIRNFEKNPLYCKECLVDADIYSIKKMIGKETKILQENESQFRPLFRKSLVSAMNIKKDTKLLPNMVYSMRPQEYIKGLPSEDYEKVVGKRINKDLKKYEPITLEILY